jgi:TRAP-type C4-dicarboxylate transport system substrate-binding protein
MMENQLPPEIAELIEKALQERADEERRRLEDERDDAERKLKKAERGW